MNIQGSFIQQRHRYYRSWIGRGTSTAGVTADRFGGRHRNRVYATLDATYRKTLNLSKDFSFGITAIGYKPNAYATDVTTLNLTGDIKGSISATTYSYGDGIFNGYRAPGGYGGGGCPPYALNRSKVYGDSGSQELNINARAVSISDQSIRSYAVRGSQVHLGGGNDVLNIEAEAVTRRTNASHHWGRVYQGISEGDAYGVWGSRISMGDGDDTVSIKAKVSTTGRAWHPSLGRDNDFLHRGSQAEVLSYSTLDLGRGDDTIKLESNTRIMGNRGFVNGGSGFDTVEITNDKLTGFNANALNGYDFSVGEVHFKGIEKLVINGVTIFGGEVDATASKDQVTFDDLTGQIIDGGERISTTRRGRAFRMTDYQWKNGNTRDALDARATENGYQLVVEFDRPHAFVQNHYLLYDFDKSGSLTSAGWMDKDLVSEELFNYDLNKDGIIASVPDPLA